MKKILILLALTSFVLTAGAQTPDKKWSMGLLVGKTEYTGDRGNGFLDFVPHYASLGLSFNRYLTPSFDLGLQGQLGDYGYFENFDQQFLARKIDGILLLKYKFNNGYLLKEKSFFAPYLAAGAGVANFSAGRELAGFTGERTIPGTDGIFPIGGGLKLNILPVLALEYQLLYNFTTSDERDMITSGGNDKFFTHSVGVVFNFGAPTDTDKDGVPDKLDKCPDTPAGVSVTPDGCPVDRDKDGIPDHLDKCPDVPGLAPFKGCPDTDGDGIQDSEDKCPTVKGLPAFKGCPDTDGDGIQDSEDKCPEVKGLQAFNGCPDTDGDGIQDSEDRCPDVKGKKELKGCPDTDNDGIADIDDKCPTVYGIRENKGCPEVKEEVKKVFDQALRGINFETNKDVIKPVSFPILDNVVSVMKNNPEYNLEINGHTDSTADDAFNLDLSQRRAEAVKKYLVEKGISAARMTPNGFGETKPVADNKTAAGRALNRRVEFKVIF